MRMIKRELEWIKRLENPIWQTNTSVCGPPRDRRPLGRGEVIRIVLRVYIYKVASPRRRTVCVIYVFKNKKKSLKQR